MERLTRTLAGPALLLTIIFFAGCSPKTVKTDDTAKPPALEERIDEKEIDAEALKKPEEIQPLEEAPAGLAGEDADLKKDLAGAAQDREGIRDEGEEEYIEGGLPEEKPIVEEPSVDVAGIEEVSPAEKVLPGEDLEEKIRIDIEKAVEKAMEKAMKDFIARAEKEMKDLESAREEKAGKVVASLPVDEASTSGIDMEGDAGLSPVYFDFDNYSIREDSREVLRKNAEWLVNHPDVRLIIEGHADERGPNEYNLALGEKRIISVISYLSDLGVKSGMISKISYGEEMPVCMEHEEACWSRNRRAEFRLISE